MAWRGRGRGRGGFGGGGGYAKQEPFVLFPENENLPAVVDAVPEEMTLVTWSLKLQKFWSSSAYHLKDEGQKKEESIDIERFSDRGKRRTGQKNKISDFIMCTVDYVPAELAQDSRPGRHVRRKVNWHQDSGLSKLDLFEKLENKFEDDEKAGKGKKNDEDEQEDEEPVDEDEDEYSTEGEYEMGDQDVEDGNDVVDDDDGGDDEGDTF